MPTNTKGTTALNFQKDVVHVLARNFTFADTGRTISLGFAPAGAVILKPSSGITMHVAQNAGTTNTVDIGTAADDNLYGTALAGGAIGFVPLDEAVSQVLDADTEFTVTPRQTGTAATAGSGTAMITFMIPSGA